MLLLNVFRSLNRYRVCYLVVGGVARSLYGDPRFTKDLDIWVDDSEENLARILKAFRALGFIPRAPVKPEEFLKAENWKRWREEKGMLAFTFINPKTPLENVDLLFEAPMPFRKAYARKSVRLVKSVKVNIISVEDLICMKKAAGRPQDLQDVEVLKSVCRKRVRRPS